MFTSPHLSRVTCCLCFINLSIWKKNYYTIFVFVFWDKGCNWSIKGLTSLCLPFMYFFLIFSFVLLFICFLFSFLLTFIFLDFLNIYLGCLSIPKNFLIYLCYYLHTFRGWMGTLGHIAWRQPVQPNTIFPRTLILALKLN